MYYDVSLWVIRVVFKFEDYVLLKKEDVLYFEVFSYFVCSYYVFGYCFLFDVNFLEGVFFLKLLWNCIGFGNYFGCCKFCSRFFCVLYC